MLVLIALVGAALVFYYEARSRALARALDREAGRGFAAWFLAAHRASQTHDWAVRLASSGGAFTLSPAELQTLGAAPPGWRPSVGRGGVFSLGLMDDGTGRGVAMAFGVLEAAHSGVRSRMRLGAVEAGLAQLAVAGGAATPMAAHEVLIELALGAPIAPGALYVTADRGVRYRERVVYRREQPGLVHLNRMETALDANFEDVTAVAALSGDSMTVDTATISGAAAVEGRAGADGLIAPSLAVGGFEAGSITLSGALTVGAAQALTVATASLSASGRIDAGRFSTSGALDASRLSGVRITIAGATTITGTVAGETVDAGSEIEAATFRVRGVSSRTGNVSGALTVGSCTGC